MKTVTDKLKKFLNKETLSKVVKSEHFRNAFIDTIITGGNMKTLFENTMQNIATERTNNRPNQTLNNALNAFKPTPTSMLNYVRGVYEEYTEVAQGVQSRKEERNDFYNKIKGDQKITDSKDNDTKNSKIGIDELRTMNPQAMNEAQKIAASVKNSISRNYNQTRQDYANNRKKGTDSSIKF